jgi:hypothetical protein
MILDPPASSMAMASIGPPGAAAFLRTSCAIKEAMSLAQGLAFSRLAASGYAN